MRALIVALVILMSSPVLAHEARSATDNIYVPILEQKVQECNEKVSTFKIKEEAFASCKVDLAKSQERFFKMNKTWIKGVLSGIAIALILI